MKSKLFVVLALVFNLPGAFANPQFELDFDPINAEEKTLQEYWKDVGLKLEHLANFITTENCYSEETAFIGCFAGINGALETARESYSLVPTSRLIDVKAKYEIVGDFGRAKIIRFIPDVGPVTPKEESLAALAKKLKIERQKNNDAIVAIFRLGVNNGIRFSKLFDWISLNILKKPDINESYLVASLYNSFLGSSLDPHTYIMPRAYWDHQNETQSEVYYGIGASMKLVDKKLIIVSPQEGSPALKAGIRANDEVVAIDGSPIDLTDVGNNIKRIKGAEGTPVTLSILRKSQSIEIKVTRGKIETKNVRFSVINRSSQSIGYIKLGQFIEKSCENIQQAIIELQSKKVTGFILDLRQNGGGRLDQAVCIVGLFTGPNQTVVTQKSLVESGPNTTNKTSAKAKKITDLPIVTLIDERSASASEIVSGALQDLRRSVILGERSYGKATVQQQFPIDQVGSYLLPPDRSVYMMFTVARFYLPSGRTNQIVGITPDVEVFQVPNPTPDDKVAFREEDEYLNSLPAVGPAYVSNRPEYVNKIKTCMAITGTANASYATQSLTAAIAPDYQRLNALDALSCM